MTGDSDQNGDHAGGVPLRRTDDPRFFETVIGTMAEGIVLQSADGTILASNESAERILGLSRDQLRGRSSIDPRWRAIHEDGSPFPGETHPAMRTLADGRAITGEVMGVHKPDGSLTWISVNTRPLFDPGESRPHAVVASFRDITDRIESERAIQATVQTLVQAKDDLALKELRTQAILDTATDAIITIGHQGRIETVNRASEAMFGYRVGELIGKNITVLMPDRYSAEHNDYLARYQATGERHIIGVGRRVEGRRRDGSEFPVQLWVNETEVAGHQFYTGVLRDLSKDEAKDKDLRQRQKLEAIGTLAGGIAHDFNNLIQGTQLALDQLRMSLDDRPELQEDIEAALRYVGHGAALVARLLAFARGEGEEGVLDPVPLCPIFQEALGLVESALPPGVRLEWQVNPETLWVQGDRTQIQQVIVNLCTNAVQAVRETGGEVRVTAVDTIQDPESAAELGLTPGRFVVLEVADDGPGISPTIEDRIFEPFFTTREVGEGTGLGLSVVHGIVRRHNGAIRLCPGYTGGSCFQVYLPYAPPQDQASSTTPEAVGVGGRVLIVDDDPRIGRLVARLARSLGYEAVAEADARRAVARLVDEGEPFDVVITDLTMPMMSGLELAVRVGNARPDLPIVLSTGYGPKAFPDAPHVSAVLPKPFSGPELAAMLAAVIGDAPDSEPGD